MQFTSVFIPIIQLNNLVFHTSFLRVQPPFLVVSNFECSESRDEFSVYILLWLALSRQMEFTLRFHQHLARVYRPDEYRHKIVHIRKRTGFADARQMNKINKLINFSSRKVVVMPPRYRTFSPVIPVCVRETL